MEATRRKEPATGVAPTIGFVCPLYAEFKAVKATFDKDLGKREIYNYDTLEYIYHYGLVAGQDVVAIYFPEADIGLIAASRYASRLLDDHPSLRRPRSHCFLVGSAGGIWSPKHDVRLGDVIFATHVLEWTFGKHLSDGFQSTKYPIGVSPELSYLLSEFLYDMEGLSRRVSEYVNSMRQKELDTGWRYPGQQRDQLFEDEYLHPQDSPDCEECDPRQLQTRRLRKTDLPKVHRGLIASGSSILRDAGWRKRLRERGVLAVEMEASAVLSVDKRFIVIRGICNYVDSHKNKSWQRYAAATAAATARLLVEQITCSVTNPEPQQLAQTFAEERSGHSAPDSIRHGPQRVPYHPQQPHIELDGKLTGNNPEAVRQSDSILSVVSDFPETVTDLLTHHSQQAETLRTWTSIQTFVAKSIDITIHGKFQQSSASTLKWARTFIDLEHFDFPNNDLPLRRLKMSTSGHPDEERLLFLPQTNIHCRLHKDTVDMSFSPNQEAPRRILDIFVSGVTHLKLISGKINVSIKFAQDNDALAFSNNVLNRQRLTPLQKDPTLVHPCLECSFCEGSITFQQGGSPDSKREHTLFSWQSTGPDDVLSDQSTLGRYDFTTFPLVQVGNEVDFLLEARGSAVLLHLQHVSGLECQN